MDAMKQITQEHSGGTTWLIDVAEFETPEMLVSYLEYCADGPEYRIDGNTIYATDQAIEAAIDSLRVDLDETLSIMGLGDQDYEHHKANYAAA